MSRKVFTAGEVLAAADVNSFLMDQSVMSSAGTAARGSAIGTATEGMVTYLEDSNLLSINDGSAWRPSLATLGGILQVVQDSNSTFLSTTSTSFIDSGLTATITPKSASSRILVIVSHLGSGKSAGGVNTSQNLNLVFPDATTQILGVSIGFTGTAIDGRFDTSGLAIYTPASLSAQTFKTQICNASIQGSTQVGHGSAVSTMTLIEVAS
jgi:hypothetical protein